MAKVCRPTFVCSQRGLPEHPEVLFELLCGRAVRGPLQVLRDLREDDVPNQGVRTTYEYVINLADRRKETWSLARAELLKANEVQKSYCDKKAKLCTLQPGQRCLVLLLTAQWKGPYAILECKCIGAELHRSCRR